MRGLFMGEIDEEVKLLIQAVKQSKTYKEYEKQKKRLKENEELKAQVDQYRKENFRLQAESDDPNIKFKLEEFADRYADFLDEPDVSAFLDAENNLCRMMQELTDRVIASLDFDLE